MHHFTSRTSKVNLEQWRIQDSPEVGCQPSRGRQHTILPNFSKNEIKEFGHWRGDGVCPKFYYVDPPLLESIEHDNGI